MTEVSAHEQSITVRVPQWVPGHEERGHDMANFEHNRAQLIRDGWGYCWGCKLAGMHVTTGLQCHHLSEWAEWDDADPHHVLALAKWWNPYGYATKLGDEPIADPNDIRLLLMLCQPCHTGAPKHPDEVITEPLAYISGGIHYAPYPLWIADRMRVRKLVLASGAQRGQDSA